MKEGGRGRERKEERKEGREKRREKAGELERREDVAGRRGDGSEREEKRWEALFPRVGRKRASSS